MSSLLLKPLPTDPTLLSNASNYKFHSGQVKANLQLQQPALKGKREPLALLWSFQAMQQLLQELLCIPQPLVEVWLIQLFPDLR